MEEDYKKKYLEYKVKYFELKKSMENTNQSGGALDTLIVQRYNYLLANYPQLINVQLQQLQQLYQNYDETLYSIGFLQRKRSQYSDPETVNALGERIREKTRKANEQERNLITRINMLHSVAVLPPIVPTSDEFE